MLHALIQCDVCDSKLEVNPQMLVNRYWRLNYLASEGWREVGRKELPVVYSTWGIDKRRLIHVCKGCLPKGNQETEEL